MPGNPLTDPNWAPDLADTVDGSSATSATRPPTTRSRPPASIVFGLLGAILGIVALVLVITFTRALQELLDLAITTARAVYLSYFTSVESSPCSGCS